MRGPQPGISQDLNKEGAKRQIRMGGERVCSPDLLACIVVEDGAIHEQGAVGDADGPSTEAFIVEEGGVQDRQVGAQASPYCRCKKGIERVSNLSI